MSLLTDRASLLREFFRLVNADSSDDDMTEHDSTTLEGAYEALQVGLHRAQELLVALGQSDRWLKTTSALTLTGSDPDRYTDLPADFLRLDSDPEQFRSALRVGTRYYGREVSPSDRNRLTGNYYYIRGNEGASGNEGRVRIYVTQGMAWRTGTVVDYYYKLSTLADSTTVDFPQNDRPLIPAYAAAHAMHQSWFPGGPEQRNEIRQNLNDQIQASKRRGRLTRRARKVSVSPNVGRYIVR